MNRKESVKLRECIVQINVSLKNQKIVIHFLFVFEVLSSRLAHLKYQTITCHCHYLRFFKRDKQWIISYLSFRKKFVKLEETGSEMYDVNLGVPQGSVLGPLIFFLFINDLPLHIYTECVVLFADDVSIAEEADSPEELQGRINKLYQQFVNWCGINKLIVNTEKTVLLQFSGRKTFEVPMNITLDQLTVVPTHSTKFLGIHIDCDMSWRHHINNTCRKISRGYYAILQLKSVLDQKSLIHVYYALINSVLAYNVILWGGATDRERVLIAQKGVIRLIFNLQKLSRVEIFSNNTQY